MGDGIDRSGGGFSQSVLSLAKPSSIGSRAGEYWPEDTASAGVRTAVLRRLPCAGVRQAIEDVQGGTDSEGWWLNTSGVAGAASSQRKNRPDDCLRESFGSDFSRLDDYSA